MSDPGPDIDSGSGTATATDTGSDAPLTSSPERMAVAFARLLRAADLDVTVGSVQLFAEALAAVGLDERRGVYWAGRATLVRRPEDQPVYDRAFRVFWEDATGVPVPPPPLTVPVTIVTDDPDAGGDDEPDEAASPVEGVVVQVRWSRTETLRHKDFAACSDAELDELHRLMPALQVVTEQRQSLRLVRSRRATRHPDLRRTVRRALATGGEPIRREFRRHSERARRLVLLLDVSGSMEPYARALIRFAHAAVVGRTKVEAFTLGTRLTRVTRELSSRDPDEALRAAGDSVEDWSGGTRLGTTLRVFNDEWGIRGLARGAIVLVLSDGWDRGDPEELATEMQRLHRVTHRLVWVNPLKHTPGYAPLARGMAAALPHVDAFVEGHSFESLDRLATVLRS
jgi:uncharacterized protein with von Willebrand factor type A (vWA) domain